MSAAVRNVASSDQLLPDSVCLTIALSSSPKRSPLLSAIVEGPAEALLLPAIAEACGLSFNEYGISIVNVGGVGLYHYARILQRADDAICLPIPVACITDRDVVPNEVDYIDPPKNGKPRFDADYTAEKLEELVKAKELRAQGGSTIVCVSNRWTLEFDLALYGCGELMHTAIHLARKADSKGERLGEDDEAKAMVEAHGIWEKLIAAGHVPEKLAALIYQPLAEGDASKAVAAQYAAHLIATGIFGQGEELFKKLPPYLQRAMEHLTGRAAKA